MFWGAAFVFVGLMILLNRLGLVDLGFSEYLLPAILIAWGVKIIGSHKNRRR